MTDAVGKHATMVAVIVNTPLHVDYVAALVGYHGRGTPVRAGLVVIDAYPGVVAAGSTAADLGSIKVRPGCDGLKNGAFGAGVCSSLSIETCTAHRLREVAMGLDACGKGKSLSYGPLHVEERIEETRSSKRRCKTEGETVKLP